MKTLLQVENLTAVVGGVQVLHVTDLELAQSQVMAVVGPNGSGKSTLLLCLAGLMDIAGGRLLFRGQEVSGHSQRAGLRRHITMVFQEPLLFDSTVKANIESGLRLHGVTSGERRRWVEEAAALFGISHLLGRSARKLSGGESQRASLARAFAIHPDVLLMDEPFSALDAPTKLALLNDLGRILKETNTTAIFSTHDLNEAIYLANHILVLNNGLLVQQGTVQDVLHNPKDSFVEALVVSLKATAEQVVKNLFLNQN